MQKGVSLSENGALFFKSFQKASSSIHLVLFCEIHFSSEQTENILENLADFIYFSIVTKLGYEAVHDQIQLNDT